MSEEEKQQQQQNPAPADDEPKTAEGYAAAIKNLKANTVSKKEFEKVVEENKVLTKALAGEGPAPESVQNKGKKPDIIELRKKFLSAGETNLTNAETVQTALELRQALLDLGEPDPFLPQGIKLNPSPQDIQKAQEVADGLRGMLDSATDENGYIDTELFNAQLRRGIAEDSPVITARLKAAAAAAKQRKHK